MTNIERTLLPSPVSYSIPIYYAIYVHRLYKLFALPCILTVDYRVTTTAERRGEESTLKSLSLNRYSQYSSQSSIIKKTQKEIFPINVLIKRLAIKMLILGFHSLREESTF